LLRPGLEACALVLPLTVRFLLEFGVWFALRHGSKQGHTDNCSRGCDPGVATPTGLREAGDSADPIVAGAAEPEWCLSMRVIEPCGLESVTNEATLADVVIFRASTSFS
jgi:hypothetical protein